MTGHWRTEAEYPVPGLDPDTDLEPLGEHATEIHYDQDSGILRLAARLAATDHPTAAAEAQQWLDRIGRHLAAAGHASAPIRHTIQTATAHARTHASGTAEAAAAIGLTGTTPSSRPRTD